MEEDRSFFVAFSYFLKFSGLITCYVLHQNLLAYGIDSSLTHLTIEIIRGFVMSQLMIMQNKMVPKWPLLRNDILLLRQPVPGPTWMT